MFAICVKTGKSLKLFVLCLTQDSVGCHNSKWCETDSFVN